MTRFVLQRLGGLVVTLAVIISLTFVLLRSAPGNPFDDERALDAGVRERLMEKYALDGPLLWQLFRYWGDLLRGDLRESLKYRNRTVAEIIAQCLPASVALGLVSFIICLSLGVMAGVVAAAYQNKWPDHAVMFCALVGISLPAFVLGPLFILLFSFTLKIAPVGGWGSFSQVWLPAVVLALPFAAYIARLTRTSMLDQLRLDYVRTARAKGVTEWKVLLVHTLRNAFLPVLSYSGPLAANIVTGSLVIELIFHIPGMGQFFVNGVLNRDVFLVCGVVIVYSSLLVLMNLLVDVAYFFFDRRIKLT
jgi:oligopeptide transport system permease protein